MPILLRPEMDNELIQKADKAYRNKCLAVYFICCLIGISLIVWWLPRFKLHMETLMPDKLVQTVSFVFLVLLVPIILFGLYILSIGRRTLKSGRYPPPGMKVIRDTKVLQGKAAGVRGYLIIINALLIIVLSITIIVYIPYMLKKLISEKKIATTSSSKSPKEDAG